MMTVPEDAAEALTERYQIRKHLGSGGNGDAYLAWDASLKREVVIKRVRAADSDEAMRQHIMEEAAKMAATKHPNIVSIYDITVADGAPCIVMEHVHGHTVEGKVQSKELLAPGELVELARQCLDALIAAHHIGLIHRDLKPSNIMLTDLPSGSFQVKVLDFGLAKFVDSATPSPQTVAIDGSISGSIFFISPEQLNRDPVDARSDLYSLGCSLYYALTGVEPFGGDTVAEVITAHLSHRVASPGSLRADLKRGLATWLMRMISREPRDRFQNAFEALDGLRAAAQRDGLTMTTGSIRVDRRSMALPATPGSRRHLTPWVVGAAVLALGAGAIVLAKRPSSHPVAARVVQPAVVAAPETKPIPVPTVIAVVPTPTPSLPPAPPAVVVAPVPVAPAEVVFQVVGSNTIGAKLMPALVQAYLERMGLGGFEAREVQPEEKEISFASADGKGRKAVVVKAHGSATAFSALLAETCDVGMASRPIKPEEAEKLAFLGDMHSPACEHVVGLDGLAVIVNRNSPVDALTVQQLADIFSGVVTDWAQVGGAPGPITIYARDDKSGTYDSFKALVLGDKPLRADAKRYEDSNELSSSVAADAGGIGFIGLPYVHNAKALALSDAGTLPMMPSPFTVGTEDYVLSRRLFLYTPSIPKNSWTASFVEFVLSDEGQKIVEAAGFIPQTVDVEKVRARPGLPQSYLDVINRTSGRLSFSFRFLSGKAELDAKGVRDLDRVVRFLARSENRSRQVFLLGFSDASGAPATNLKLSKERADEVARQLAMRGVSISEAVAFGQELPVASNATKPGQEKNRRVEVWLEEPK